MAQELIDKIRAAAQAKNVNPDVAVQIARNESSLNPSSKTNASSAAGLFGVIDSTWKQFGGQPGKKLNPDENIRVGVDVIASNTDFLRRNLGREPSPSEIYTAHFFGPAGARTILNAAPDTPVSSLFSAQVLEANPHLKGKTAEQTRQWLSKKMSGTTPARARAQAQTPAPATAAPQPAAMEPPLGISAAAAPRVGARAVPVAASAEDLGSGYKAALALAFLGDQDKEREVSDDELRTRMNRIEDEEFAQQLADYKPVNALQDLEITALNPVKALQPVKMADGGEAKKDEPKNDSAMRVRGAARAALDKVVSLGMGPGMGANLGYNIYKHFSGKTPLEDLLRDARQANQPIDPTRDMEPMSTTGGLSGGMPPVRRSNGSPEGGEVALTPEEIAAASRPATFNPQIARQGAAARALAAQRDVNTLPDPRTYAAVSGFLGQAPDQLGFSVFHPDLQGIKRAGEAGFAVGLVPAVAPVVAPVARAVGRGATALGMRTEKALEAPVTRTLERGGRSAEMLQALGAQPSFAVKPRGGDFLTSGSISAPPASKLDDLLQNYSKAIKLSMPPGTDPKIVDDFVDKKARKYFTTAFGTADDPVRTAITKGEIKMFGNEAEDVGGITPYLLEAARNPNAAGHEMAKKHLEQVYDRYTNIQSRVYSTTPSSDADARRALQKVGEDFQARNRALMTQEGVPEGFQNPPGTTIFRDTDIQNYSSLYGPYVSALELRAQGALPPQSAYLLDKSKPFYDIYTSPAEMFNPMKVAEGLATLPASKLGNMSFEQAFIQGTKNMEVYRDYLVAVDRARNNQSVPKEVIEMFTKPVDKTPGGQWVRLTDPQATRLEGALMHHSVGGYADYGSYNHGGKQAFLDGKAQVVSLREPKTGRPLVTVEGKKDGDKIDFTQIKGPYNSFPSMQGNDLFTLVNKDPSVQRLPGQNYYKDNTGKDLPKPISVDWGKSFDNWKAQDGAGDWIIESESPATINYIWGMPEAKARGGMVERKRTDNRAYL